MKKIIKFVSNNGIVCSLITIALAFWMIPLSDIYFSICCDLADYKFGSQIAVAYWTFIMMVIEIYCIMYMISAIKQLNKKELRTIVPIILVIVGALLNMLVYLFVLDVYINLNSRETKI